MNIRQDALKTLIGIILIKIANGVMTTWGSLNLYILSYLHQQGQTVTSSTNSLIILAIVIPVSIIILWAAWLSNRFGYQKMIRCCAILFLISPQLIAINFSTFNFTIFCVFLPAVSFATSSIPAINCLWTQFPESKHKATAIAIISFGIGGILWNFIFTFTVNPNNLTSNIYDQETSMHFFGPEVTHKVPTAVRVGFLICGIFFVAGSLLIRKNHHLQPDTALPQSIHDKKQQLSDYEIFDIKTEPMIRQLKRMSNGILSAQKDSLAQKIILQNAGYKQKQHQILSDLLMDRRFISVFMVSFLSGLYQIFISINLKIIYMPIIGDDHFLAYCAMLKATISIGGAFFWGYIGDKKGFQKTIQIFTVLDFVFKLYGCFATSKVSLVIMFILLGITDRGMATMMGPGLVQLFGISAATQLLPYKGISMFMGFLLAPIMYLLLSSLLAPLQYLRFLLIFSLISIYISLKLPTIASTIQNKSQPVP